MCKNEMLPSQEIKNIIKKFNLSSTEVELIFITIIKEMEVNELLQKICEAFTRSKKTT